MKYILFTCLICLGWIGQSQTITILDQQTKEPVVGVAVYNSSKAISTVSGIDGKVSLSGFRNDERIFFQHISYIKAVYVKSNISDTVWLKMKPQSLDEVVISSSKFEQKRREIAQKISSVKIEDIAISNPQTSADLLKSSGQVFVQKSQLGGGSPIIRGFSTNRLTLIVDDVRFNNAIFRTGNVQNVISIDPFAIQNSEVTLGAGSVIYGSDAIGGVINFYSLKPKLSTSDEVNFKLNATTRYASATDENTAHVDFNFGFKKWAFLSSISYTDFEDLRAGTNNGSNDILRPDFVRTENGQDEIVINDDPSLQRGSGYDQINLLQKIQYKANERLTFDLGLHYTRTSDYDRFDRLIQRDDDGTLRFAEWFFGPQQWFLANFQATKLSSRSNLYDKIKFTAAYQNYQESRNDRRFGNADLRNREEEVDAISANLDFEKTISRTSKLFYGVEYVYNLVGSTARQTNIFSNEVIPITTRYPDGSTWQSIAAYLSYKYRPSTKLTFQTGVRYNFVSINANLADNNSFFNFPFEDASIDTDALTGTAGLSWSPNNVVHWKLNLSTAFRAPNIDDIGKIFDSEPGSVVVPNPDLRPEYAYSGELGVGLNFGNIVLDLAGYYTYLDNALIRRDFSFNGASNVLFDGQTSNVQAIQNAARSNIYGFEAGIQVDLSRDLKLKSQYNIIRGTEEDKAGIEGPVRHVSPDFGNTHLVWEKNKLTLDAYAEYNAELSADEISSELSDFLFARDENGNPFSPSWYTLNLRSQYKVNDQFTVTGTVENITDQLYRPYSSGISAPGLNVIVALRYNL